MSRMVHWNAADWNRSRNVMRPEMRFAVLLSPGGNEDLQCLQGVPLLSMNLRKLEANRPCWNESKCRKESVSRGRKRGSVSARAERKEEGAVRARECAGASRALYRQMLSTCEHLYSSDCPQANAAHSYLWWETYVCIWRDA